MPDSQIQIFDLTGHLIKSLKTTNSHNEIQLNKKGVFVSDKDNRNYLVDQAKVAIETLKNDGLSKKELTKIINEVYKED